MNTPPKIRRVSHDNKQKNPPSKSKRLPQSSSPSPRSPNPNLDHSDFIPVETVQQSRDRTRSRVIRFLFVVLIATYAQQWTSSHDGNDASYLKAHSFADPLWSPTSESKGVQLYKYVDAAYDNKSKSKSKSKSEFMPVRGTMYTDLHISYIMNLLFDVSRSKEWVKVSLLKFTVRLNEEYEHRSHYFTNNTISCASLRSAPAQDLTLVEEHEVRNNLDGVLLQRYSTPTLGLIADREFLVKRKVKKNNFLKTVIITYESFEDKKRFPVCKGCVRANSKKTVWSFRSLPNGGTAIDLQAFVEPNGSLPPLLVNFIQKTWPSVTLSKLVSVSAKSNSKKKHHQFLQW